MPAAAVAVLPAKYHQGMPLIAGISAVSGPIIGCSSATAPGQSCAFHGADHDILRAGRGAGPRRP